MRNLQRLPKLTVEQVQAGARPGETWCEARRRLEAARYAVSQIPCIECGHPVHHYANVHPPCLCLDCKAELIAELDPRLKAATQLLGLNQAF